MHKNDALVLREGQLLHVVFKVLSIGNNSVEVERISITTAVG